MRWDDVVVADTKVRPVKGSPLEDDRAWVAAFKRGDRAALGRVFLTYADDVARQVRATRVAEHEVEALVQELFVKALSDNARQSWDGLRSYGAWLNTMTRNMLIDRARRERRLDFRAPDDMPVMVDTGPDPAASHDATELQTVLVAFRAELSVDEEALFRTRFEDNTSMSVSAKVLGWSEIRVRKLDTALRVRLLQALQGAGFVQSTRVKIGSSLLLRKEKKSPDS